jgi:carboxyl-terminal processing protease
MEHKRFVALGFFGTLLAGLLLLNSSLFARGLGGSPSDNDSRHKALSKFVNVLDLVEKYNVDPITATEIINKALTGMLSNLDAHSNFLNEEHFKSLKVQTDGEFGGLGITVGMKDGALTVISPIEGTPADEAGLKAGDIILKIEKKSTLNMSIDEAVKLMRGKPKTPINLTIYRKGEKKPLSVHIIRDIIKIQSVYAKTIGEDLLYIRVVSFDKKVVADVKKQLSKHLPNRKGIILDLRNNPGGLLDQAVGLVDLFVSDGDIVSQKGRNKQEQKVYSATSGGTYEDVPIVVLVNAGSASASEIVSGALQDLKRAIVVGTKTFGKGSVQIIMPVSNTEAIKLTIARYYLPSGRTIQAVGVTPDIEVIQGKVTKEEENGFSIKESDLKNRLKGELAKIDGKGSKDDDKKSAKKKIDKKRLITQEMIDDDLQLKSGIDILKALVITNH